MIVFELPDQHPLVISLNEMKEWAMSSDLPTRVSKGPPADLSEENLNAIINKEKTTKCIRAKFTDYNFDNINKLSAKIYEEKTGIKNYEYIPVARTYYPANGGYIGWHIDKDGDRLYASWTEGESFFRIRDPQTKKIVTSYDKTKKWVFRIFSFDNTNPLWHCVYSKDTRISVGSRFVRL